jgi:hypothetical protein
MRVLISTTNNINAKPGETTTKRLFSKSNKEEDEVRRVMLVVIPCFDFIIVLLLLVALIHDHMGGSRMYVASSIDIARLFDSLDLD